jgi:hypothetical protein
MVSIAKRQLVLSLALSLAVSGSRLDQPQALGLEAPSTSLAMVALAVLSLYG